MLLYPDRSITSNLTGVFENRQNSQFSTCLFIGLTDTNCWPIFQPPRCSWRQPCQLAGCRKQGQQCLSPSTQERSWQHTQSAALLKSRPTVPSERASFAILRARPHYQRQLGCSRHRHPLLGITVKSILLNMLLRYKRERGVCFWVKITISWRGKQLWAA